MASVAYDDVKNSIVYLPINSENTVTKPRIIVAGERAGIEPFKSVVSLSGVFEDYYPSAIAYEYDGSGLDPALLEVVGEYPVKTRTPFHDFNTIPSFGTFNSANMTNPTFAHDGDPGTLTHPTSYGTNAFLQYVYDSTALNNGYIPYGVYVKFTVDRTGATSYLSETEDQTNLVICYKYGSFHEHRIHYVLPEAKTDPVGILVIAPPDIRFNREAWNTNYPFDAAYVLLETIGASSFTVTHMLPLLLNLSRLEQEAKAILSLSGQKPFKFQYSGILPCDKQHTITGFPGGDYVGSVVKQVYAEGITEVSFEERLDSVDGQVYSLKSEIERAMSNRTAKVTFGART